MKRELTPRFLGQLAVLAIAYYITAWLSLRLALVGENVTPLWPPTGIAVVALVVFGRRLWPAIFLGAFAVNTPISSTVFAAAMTAIGNTLAPLLAARLLDAAGFRPALERVRDALALIFLAALLSMTVSATIGASTLALTDATSAVEYAGAWSVWWVGDAMGVLIVAPVLLTVPKLPRLIRSWPGALEAVTLVTTLSIATAVVVTSPLPLLFVVLPLLGWASWRFQHAAAAPAALLTCGFVTWAVVSERGVFAGRSLLEQMLMLQGFNASTAFISLFFATLVAERENARAAADVATVRLEERVQERTRALASSNRRLSEEIAARSEIEAKLRRSERLLREAQQLANVGSWRWDMRTGDVEWSDQLYRIHGHRPGTFAVTLESAMAQIVEEDVARIRANIDGAIEHRSTRLEDIEYRIVRPDGATRVLLGRGRLSFGPDGLPVQMVGTVHDVTERRERRREHEIADTLQRVFMPEELSPIEGLRLAARYIPAEAHAYAGGDWFDVIPLPTGAVALVIGDVAGHGLHAASIMGQVRMALRAYALEGLEPAAVVARTDAMLRKLYPGEMVTLLYAVLERPSGMVRVLTAGHPPPLLLQAAATPRFVDTVAGPPLGVGLSPATPDAVFRLESNACLVLYTDGLIDRRDVPITDGFDRLKSAAGMANYDPEALCDRLVDSLVPSDAADDVAILACALDVEAAPLRIRIDARAEEIASVRHALATWTAALGVDAVATQDLVLACSEACANAIEHAYRSGSGPIDVEGAMRAGSIELLVRDFGRWTEPPPGLRGRGLRIMESCVDWVAVVHRSDGTDLRMRRDVRLRGDEVP